MVDEAHRTYQLLIEVTKTVIVQVGRLGCFEFVAGNYIYTGSALRNCAMRCAISCRS